MVAMGMHHGLVALYSVQLETIGYVTLYPALAMAGAGRWALPSPSISRPRRWATPA